MSTIRLRTFGGLVPKTAPQLLPEIAAQTATNVDVRRGDLRPVNDVNAGTVIGQVLTCGTAGTTTIATWNGITDGSFRVTVGGVQKDVTSITFASMTSMVQVAYAIWLRLHLALINQFMAVVYWDNVNGRFVLCVENTISVLSATGSGTDISGGSYMNGQSGLISEYHTLKNTVTGDGDETTVNRFPVRVSVADNPLQNDSYGRYFASGFGWPSQFYRQNDIAADLISRYVLGLDVPTEAPIPVAVSKGSVAWTRTWYAYYEEPDGSQVDAFTEGVNFTVATTTVGSVYHTHVAGVDGIPAKVTATANAVFVLYFDAYDAAGSLLGRVYPQHSVYKDNSDLFINGAEVTGNQVNATAATMTLTYDTSRVSDYSIDRKYVYGWLNYPFNQESGPSPESATVSVSPAQNGSVTNLGIYDPTKIYAVDDIVIYLEVGYGASSAWIDTQAYVYKCLSAGTTGTWDASKWIRRTDPNDPNSNLIVQTIRLYRTVTTSAGTQYQFVADIALATLQPLLEQTETLLTAGPVVDKGGGLVGIPCTAHPFRAGSYVTFTGLTNYAGSYWLHGTTSVNEMVIYATYVAETVGATDSVAARVTQHQMRLNNAAAVDHTPQVAIPCTGHGFLAGESITIAGTTNYNGTFTVHASTTANEIWITSAYNAETFAGTETVRWSSMVGFPVPSHGCSSGDVVIVRSSTNYTGTHTVLSSTTVNEIVVTASYVTEAWLSKPLRPYTPRAYVDSIADADCGTVIATTGFVPPPDTLDGLVNAPGGFLVGFVGNTVYCSAQYLPHAWPYQYTVPHTVVGLGISGNMIVVLTEGDPYGLVGDTPGALSLIRIPLKQSCVSIQSIVSHLGKVYYASPDGIAVIAGGEGALLTGHLWTRAQWQALTPTAAKCQIHDEQLYINFSGNGNNLVTNGTFTTDLTGWSGTNWEWYSGNGGTMYHTGGNTAPAVQTISSLIAGRRYRVTYTIFWFLTGSGSVTVSLGGTSGITRADTVYEVTYTEIIVAGSSNSLIAFTPTSNFDACRVDNVIVVPIDTYILDLSGAAGGQLTYTDETITALYSDPVTDLLYTTAAGYLKTINGGTTAKLGTWKSKEFLSPTPVRWSCGKVLAESYGTDLVTNGAFATGDLTGWTGAGWSYLGSFPSQAKHTAGSTAALTQTIAFTDGRVYLVTYTVGGMTAGSTTVGVGGAAGTARSTAGTYSEFITARSGGTLTITPTTDFNGGVSAISATPVLTTLSLYADGILSATVNITSAKPFRLPSVTPKRRWSVQLETYATAINEVCLGTSMGAMMQMEPQV